MAKLLIVDDEPDMRQYMRTALERGGYQVTTASSPKEAVSILEHERFDAVLLDVDMPNMDGVSFARVLRQNPTILGHRDVPILMVTGRDDPGVIGESFDAGAQFFVKKPFSPRELLHAIRLVLDES